MLKASSEVTAELMNRLKILVRKDNSCTRSFLTSSARLNSNITWESAKPFTEIPSVLMLPVIGTAWQSFPIIGRYRADRQHLANRDKRKRMGNIIREKFGPWNVVMCYSLESVEGVFRAEGKYPNRTALYSLKAYRESRKDWFKSPGLLSLQGKEWFELRNKTQKHILKPMAVLEYLEPMQEVSRDFVKRMFDLRDANREIPEILKELCKWSLEAICLVGLDARLGCLESGLSPDSDAMKMVRSINTTFECMTKLEPFTGNLPFWKLFSTPTWKRFTEASDVYSQISFKYINKALEDFERGKWNKNRKLTVLQAMLAEKDLDVSDTVIFVSDLIAAGVETTSHAVGFLLYHLGRNPDKQELLYQEVMRVMPTEDVKLNSSIFEELKFLKGCLNESMRLTPTVIGLGRVLAKDTVLSGYQVPAGTFAAVFNEPIYMDETIFKNPTQFLPERWLNRNERPPRFSFIPFGFGSRSCIGKRLAELEMVALIAEIMRKFKVEYNYEEIGVYTQLLNVPDKQLRFNFIER